MGFSYNKADLSTQLNRVRFLVQDTTDEGHFFEDEEIAFAINQDANIYRVAAGLCRAIAAKLAKTPSMNATDSILKFESDKRAETYLKLAETYDEKADQSDSSLEPGDDSSLNLPSLPDRPPSFTRDLHFS